MTTTTPGHKRPTVSDLKAIHKMAEMEIATLGAPPTLESIQTEYSESQRLISILDGIRGAGQVMTLLVAESIQSGAVLIIGTVFGLLEYHRVLHGALALGQTPEQAALIALAVVCANVVHPIYALRGLRGQPKYTIVRPTMRGYLAAFWRKLTGRPTAEDVNWSYNPTLHAAATVITWTTIFLAVYDLIAPLLTSILTHTATKPGLILAIELVMGLGLSLAGVFFLQAAAHEIGVRTLTDQPKRPIDLLAERRRERAEQEQAIRERVKADYLAGQLLPQQEKSDEAMHPLPVGERMSMNGTH